MSLSRKKPLMAKSGLKSTGNGLKSTGNGLKQGSGLKVSSGLKKGKRINVKSSRQKDTDREYRKVTKKMAENRPHTCTGCGKVHGLENLSHSHIIPRGRDAKLTAIYINVTYHCLSATGNGCHEKWESPRRVELLDYKRNMRIVKQLDSEYYNILIAQEEIWYKPKK